MGKSLGNFYTLDHCREHGIEPLALRFFYLGAHYRQLENFTWEAAQAAQNALTKLRDTVRDWDAPTEIQQDYDKRFMTELHDDINTAAALGVLWELVGNETVETEVKAATLLKWNQILGLGLQDHIAKPLEIPENVQAIAARRWEARANKDWDTADDLRLELENLGWTMEDGAETFRLRPAK